MPTLKISSKEKKHDHVVYLQDDGIGITSRDNGHTHDVIYSPEIPAVIDQQTGEVMQPFQPAKSVILPSEDGHTHEIEGPIEEEEQKASKTTDKKLAEVMMVYDRAYKADRQYYSDAKRAEGYYFGDGQWDSRDRAYLSSSNRPALTINRIDPIIKSFIGFAQQNILLPRPSATERGDETLADIYWALFLNILDQNDYTIIKSDFDEDLAVTGRASFSVWIDYSKNIEGDIRVEHVPWDNVYYQHHDKKNLEDCEGAVFFRWVNVDRLKLLYPDKYNEIEKADFFVSTYESADFQYDFVGNDLIDIDEQKVKLVMAQSREYRRVVLVANIDDDFYLDGMEGRVSSTRLDKKLVSQILTIDGFQKVDRVVEEIRVQHFAGPVLLKDEISPFSKFSFATGYGTKRKGKVKGKIYDLTCVQDEINKIRSVNIDVNNKMAAYGYFYEEDTFDDKKEETMFLEERGKPGFAIKVSDINKRPVREDGLGRAPSELFAQEERAERDLFSISGISPELIGVGSNATSTPLFQIRRDAALRSQEFLFLGMSLATKQLGRLLLEAIRIVYTPDRVIRILESKNADIDPEAKRYAKKELERIWDDQDISKYDIVITESPNTPTKLTDEFTTLATLAGQGVPGINAEVLIKSFPNMSAERKKELITIANQQAQAEMQLEQAKIQSEVQKTQIAAQAKRSEQQPPQQF